MEEVGVCSEAARATAASGVGPSIWLLVKWHSTSRAGPAAADVVAVEGPQS